MAFWKQSFLDKVRGDWLRRITRVQYQANGIWFDAVITEKTIQGNSMILMTQTADNQDLTITKIRLIDGDGGIAGEISENIVKAASQGVITRWEFPLTEVVE